MKNNRTYLLTDRTAVEFDVAFCHITETSKKSDLT